MGRTKITDITVGEMRRLREEGLSNKDIANVLDICYPTVLRWIGPQEKRMDNLAAFNAKKKEPMPVVVEEKKVEHKAIDSLRVAVETVFSAENDFYAEIDYDAAEVLLCGQYIPFYKIPELTTFIVGMAARISKEEK